MSLELAIMVGSLFFLAGIGVPIAYAIIVASMAYMLAAGTSIGIVGKTLTDGIYQSFLLLAVPPGAFGERKAWSIPKLGSIEPFESRWNELSTKYSPPGPNSVCPCRSSRLPRKNSRSVKTEMAAAPPRW